MNDDGIEKESSSLDGEQVDEDAFSTQLLEIIATRAPSSATSSGSTGGGALDQSKEAKTEELPLPLKTAAPRATSEISGSLADKHMNMHNYTGDLEDEDETISDASGFDLLEFVVSRAQTRANAGSLPSLSTKNDVARVDTSTEKKESLPSSSQKNDVAREEKSTESMCADTVKLKPDKSSSFVTLPGATHTMPVVESVDDVGPGTAELRPQVPPIDGAGPGAYAVGGIGIDPEPHLIQDPHPAAIDEEAPESRNAGGLVEARPVDDTNGTNLAITAADEYDPEARHRRSKQRFYLRTCFMAMAVLGVLVLVVAGVLIARATRQEKISTVQPSVAPSPSPSAAPSSILDRLQENLPAYTLASLQDPFSPQSQAFTWIAGYPDFQERPLWRQIQLFVLATFFYSFEGLHWPLVISDHWMQYDKDECLWFSSEFGLFEDGQYNPVRTFELDPCNEQGEFQQLSLVGLNLTSYDPVIPKEIELLTSLQVLAVPYNGINASIWDFVPKELPSMENLTSLLVHVNLLHGTLPTDVSLLTNLKDLRLGSNPLTGPIPTQLALLTNLELLHLYSTLTTGTLPSEFGLLTNMQEFQFYDNAHTGTIPTELVNLSDMTLFICHLTGLSGTVPSEIGLLTLLTGLAMSSSSFYGSFYGTLPTQIGLLSNMQYLYFELNHLTGTIPTEIGFLSNLEVFSLWENFLTGAIPSEVGLATDLQIIALPVNNLTGTIPWELALPPNLTHVFLHNNSLTGELAPGFLNKTSLLSLGANDLSGTISDELCLLGELPANAVQDQWVGLYFDCDDDLCGCTWCPCTNSSWYHHSMDGNETNTSSVFHKDRNTAAGG